MNTSQTQSDKAAKELTKKADKLRAMGVIDFTEWRDIHRRVLGMPLTDGEGLTLSRTAHNDIQRRVQTWFDEELARELDVVADHQ